MAPKTIRVLLVEDNPEDVQILRRLLRDAGGTDFTLVHSHRCGDALHRLATEPFDVLLLDLSLPESRGLETFTIMAGHAPSVPVMVLTGFDDETVAMLAVREGAQDYLVKGQGDGRLVARALRSAIERHRLAAALQTANAQLLTQISRLEQRNREITLLSDMGALLQGCLTVQEASQVIAQFGQRLSPTEAGALYILDETQHLTEVMAGWGETPVGETVFLPHECWALRRGRVHVVAGPQTSLLCPHVSHGLVPASPAAPPQRYLCIPMLA